MKKTISLLIISFFITSIRAQVKLGVAAGLHSSDFASLSSPLHSNASTLFHGGFILDMKIPASSIHIHAQALYTTLGYQSSNILAVDKSGNDIGLIGNEKIGYVQVPVLLLYSIGLPGMHVKFGAGPFAGFETNQKTRIANGGDTFGNTISPERTSGPSSTLIGGEVLGDIELSRFFVSVQYTRSFNNIYKNTASSDAKWKIGAIGFSLGFFLK